MKRPIWLLSMDSEQFYAAPTTTATLKAYYRQYGQNAGSQQIELVHFRDAEAIPAWQQQWQDQLLAEAQAALACGLQPVVGFSMYTWNAAEFLALAAFLKHSLPQLLVIAGGPHVQQAEDYLGQDPIDLIILGEGERTFTELLDADNNDFSAIAGLAWLQDGQITRTAARERIRDLNEIPSPLSVLPLTDGQGKPLYESISYETSRGCPFTCAFCEWGTGAIGSKMNQFSMQRIRDDWEKIVRAGIQNIWLADSNFGALKEDLAKTQLICELKQHYGLPSTFATSWSKKHSPQVQEIVLLLNQHGLLPHYQLALQTLTPLALELSNRKNMAANKYQPIAKAMAEADVPIAAELIWGLPGDNLADFEKNLDTLLATFPNINIFGYTLLPGTEFYRKRHEYQIKAIPVAGYGKAKGEYVIGCHTFSEEEGMEGYFLISAHIILIHGHLLPLTTRYLALESSVPVSTLLRQVLYAVLGHLQDNLDFDISDRMAVYENRAAIYLALFASLDDIYQVMKHAINNWLLQHGASQALQAKTRQHLAIDKALAPRGGEQSLASYHFEVRASAISRALGSMEIPADALYQQAESIKVETPGGVGSILKDPNGGGWLKGRISQSHTSLAIEA